MSMRRIALFQAAGLVVLASCGGGPAPNSGITTDSYDPHGSTRDPPGSSRDPAADRESPPSSGDPAPPSADRPPIGGSSGGPPTGCFACQNATYACSGSINGIQVQGLTVRVQSKNGQCVTEADQSGEGGYVFACSRKITSTDGVAIGTWTALDNGGVGVTISGIQLACFPQQETPKPGGQQDAG
jgi:hypothetical protein